LSPFVDTNVLVRHLTGDPPEMAVRATAYLRRESELLLTDLVAAETVSVLESFYARRGSRSPKRSGLSSRWRRW